MTNPINISDFTYDLAEHRIAKFPLENRDDSKLLLYNGDDISHTTFNQLANYLPDNALVVFNNTKVVRARLIFHKPTGARIEIFCLEPFLPADYERAFAARGECQWHCMIGNARKFNAPLTINHGTYELTAERVDGDIIKFKWSGNHTFGELLEELGRIPIPPYLRRDTEDIDTERYQTTYAKFEGSVAAPTAGLHFTVSARENIKKTAEVTLHVGAGTFLPVSELDATKHIMHIEFFNVSLNELEKLAANQGNIVAVGTTTVRTLESLAVLGRRVIQNGSPNSEKSIGQWEAYQDEQFSNELSVLCEYMKQNNIEKLFGSTQIMITPGYKFRTIKGLITNFHQPKSTLLLLISAIVGQKWIDIYQYAMDNDFRFLSYGDSSFLELKK